MVVHLDAPVTHGFHKLVVLPLGALHPQHIIKQQIVVVAGGQALQAEIRPVNDDLAQLADFGIYTKFVSSYVISL